MKSGEIISIGMLFIVIGVIVIIAGIVKEAAFSREGTDGKIRGGGVIMIGPIPLIFGTERESAATVIVLALLLVVISYLFYRGR